MDKTSDRETYWLPTMINYLSVIAREVVGDCGDTGVPCDQAGRRRGREAEVGCKQSLI
jgi:hypothetical protein